MGLMNATLQLAGAGVGGGEAVGRHEGVYVELRRVLRQLVQDGRRAPPQRDVREAQVPQLLLLVARVAGVAGVGVHDADLAPGGRRVPAPALATAAGAPQV